MAGAPLAEQRLAQVEVRARELAFRGFRYSRMSGSCRAAMSNSREAPPQGRETTCQSSEAQSSPLSASVARSRASPTFVAYKRRAAALIRFRPREPK